MTIKADFDFHYFRFFHNIDDELLQISEIKKVIEELPSNFVEYSKIPFCIQSMQPTMDLIDLLNSTPSWIIIRHIQQIPRYKALMHKTFQKICLSDFHSKDDCFDLASFIFISSPNFVTPFHIDPEHNFLFQIAGEKEVLVNDASIVPLISSSEIEDFYADEFGYSLNFNPDYLSGLTSIKLSAGEGVYIPFTFPHMVLNGNDISISYSLTFRTKMSERHRRVHLANRALRLLGLRTKKYGESQFRDSLKSQLFPFLNLVNVRKKSSDL